jgi:hypothetical protein
MTWNGREDIFFLKEFTARLAFLCTILRSTMFHLPPLRTVAATSDVTARRYKPLSQVSPMIQLCTGTPLITFLAAELGCVDGLVLNSCDRVPTNVASLSL